MEEIGTRATDRPSQQSVSITPANVVAVSFLSGAGTPRARGVGAVCGEKEVVETLTQGRRRQAVAVDGIEQAVRDVGDIGAGVLRAPHQQVERSGGGDSVHQHQHAGGVVDPGLCRRIAVTAFGHSMFDLVVVRGGDVDVQAGGPQVVRHRARSSATQHHNVSGIAAYIEDPNLPGNRRRRFGHFRHNSEGVTAVGVVNMREDGRGGRCHLSGVVAVQGCDLRRPSPPFLRERKGKLSDRLGHG